MSEEVVDLPNSTPNSPVFATSSGSFDQQRTVHETMLSTNPEDESIVRLLSTVTLLLCEAQDKSKPTSSNRYDVSNHVTADDFLRNGEWDALVGLIQDLKRRLSVERILLSGPPQNQTERELFDELLVRHSNYIISEQLSVNGIHTSVSLSGGSGELQRCVSTSQAAPHSSTDSSVPHSYSDSGAIPNQQATVAGTSVESSSSTENLTDVTKKSSFINVNVDVLKEILLHTPCDVLSRLKNMESTQPEFSTLLQTIIKNKESNKCDQEKSAKKRKLNDDEETVETTEEETSDEAGCQICFEDFSTGGDHRVSCLKCGHLFGYKCIERWVSQAHTCPQCKTPARKGDIRSIFATRIKARDTSERDRAMRLLNEETSLRRTLERKEAAARKNLEIQQAENDVLKVQISVLQSYAEDSGGCKEDFSKLLASSSNPICSNAPIEVPKTSKKFSEIVVMDITTDGTCRVFDYSTDLGMSVVSMKSQNNLFRGFGIRLLSRDFRAVSFMPIHSGPIRDMSFRPGSFDGLLLTSGMDKTVQLVGVTSKTVVQKYSLNMNAWCCAWNTTDTNLFYAGMDRGVVKEFDIRRTDTSVQDVIDIGGPPISSLQYWPGEDNNRFKGILVAQMQNLMFEEKTEEGFTNHVLPNQSSSLMHVSLHSSGRFLVSTRPRTALFRCQYELCSLAKVEDSVLSRQECSWEGGNLQAVISRNCLMSQPDTESGLLAVTANHSSNTVKLFSSCNKQEFQSLNIGDKAKDIKEIRSNNGAEMLGILTDRRYHVYKWN